MFLGKRFRHVFIWPHDGSDRVIAEHHFKADLALEGVARAAGLEVTAEEIGAEINVLAQAYGRDPKGFAKQLDRSGQIVTLAGDIIRTKALDLLVEHADINDEAELAESKEPESSKETE